MLKEAKDEFQLTLKTNVTTLSLSAVKSENGDQNSTLSLSQGDKEVAKLVVLFKYEDGRMNELDLTMSAPSQGLTMNLIEKNAKDGSFEGNMNAGIGNATWTGKVDHRALMALHLHGAVVGTTLAVDLEAKNGDMIYGPLVMKSGNTIDFAADI